MAELHESPPDDEDLEEHARQCGNCLADLAHFEGVPDFAIEAHVVLAVRGSDSYRDASPEVRERIEAAYLRGARDFLEGRPL